MLIAFAGLPGTGKSTLARLVARRLPAAYLRVDAAEAGLIEAGLAAGPAGVGAAGYLVTGRLAGSCLDAGVAVVADAVNPVAEAREGWRRIAAAKGVPLLFVEVTCSDTALHRRRVEARETDLPVLPVPSWQQVVEREYEPWEGDRLVIDNIGAPEPQVERILAAASSPR
ncbi:adenylyl-sulfate kinase [Amycolatopsis antarctica]|uniref:Adenylyl-sulfate kinase n=1 Tax=Amycolatopsis antarctica TaxID=1854586 RepID=A0A263D9Y6_9PSEU|nr:AAA family ATPase [Amycolatopsis antarctica]OZM74808.1 adenylyl-sulfate kinase [Amycolatopsis antarctica]